MPDKMTPQQRHNCMSHIRSKNTRPEVLVRQYLHAAGFRFRIHVKKLPGCPDVVLPKYRTCIFVNGCFWHGHRGCRYAARPKSNAEFWQTVSIRLRTTCIFDSKLEATCSSWPKLGQVDSTWFVLPTCLAGVHGELHGCSRSRVSGAGHPPSIHVD